MTIIIINTTDTPMTMQQLEEGIASLFCIGGVVDDHVNGDDLDNHHDYDYGDHHLQPTFGRG